MSPTNETPEREPDGPTTAAAPEPRPGWLRRALARIARPTVDWLWSFDHGVFEYGVLVVRRRLRRPVTLRFDVNRGTHGQFDTVWFTPCRLDRGYRTAGDAVYQYVTRSGDTVLTVEGSSFAGALEELTNQLRAGRALRGLRDRAAPESSREVAELEEELRDAKGDIAELLDDPELRLPAWLGSRLETLARSGPSAYLDGLRGQLSELRELYDEAEAGGDRDPLDDLEYVRGFTESLNALLAEHNRWSADETVLYEVSGWRELFIDHLRAIDPNRVVCLLARAKDDGAPVSARAAVVRDAMRRREFLTLPAGLALEVVRELPGVEVFEWEEGILPLTPIPGFTVEGRDAYSVWNLVVATSLTTLRNEARVTADWGKWELWGAWPQDGWEYAAREFSLDAEVTDEVTGTRYTVRVEGRLVARRSAEPRGEHRAVVYPGHQGDWRPASEICVRVDNTNEDPSLIDSCTYFPTPETGAALINGLLLADLALGGLPS